MNSQEQNKSYFHWLSHKNNYIFIIEGGRKLRTISISDEPGKELHCASLNESKVCTSFSWNKDAKVLALVVNKSQIYLWEVANNNFTHFKPVDRGSSSSNNKRSKTKEIDLILWSKVSDKLLVCYSTGQLLLACFETNLLERFVDNCDGVLGKIAFVERSDHVDLFVCVTVVSEVLVMTFDGDPKLYIQREDSDIMKVSFSPPSTLKTSLNHHHQINRSSVIDNNIDSDNCGSSTNSNNGSGGISNNLNRYQTSDAKDESLWLSYKNMDNKILLKRIMLNTTSRMLSSCQSDILFNEVSTGQELIDFHWLNSSHLIAGFSSGLIQLIEVKYTINTQIMEVQVELIHKEVLDIKQDFESCRIYNNNNDRDNQSLSPLSLEYSFKAFELKSHNYLNSTSNHRKPSSSSSEQAFSLIALTDYKVFYYELIEFGGDLKQYSFEKIDDLDLTGSLQKINLKLARVEWSHDCSMLALQLSNGHILIYRTRLQDYLVVSYGSKAAYLSSINEITILNYEYESNDDDVHKNLIGDNSSQDGQHSPVESSYNALTLNVSLKPSVMAIGPKHLAIALNNRVRFYLTIAKMKEQKNEVQVGGKNIDNLPYYEEEYVSIVVALKLCSRFVAILFDDGRLKLEMIKSSSYQTKKLKAQKNSTEDNTDNNDDTNLDERYFPDPTNPEMITSFILTENLFLYCTAENNINVFCLKDWIMKQTLNYANLSNEAISKLVPNGSGNKFVCILRKSNSSNSDNVFLYDLYANSILRFVESDLYQRLFDSQLSIENADAELVSKETISQQQQIVAKLNLIIDAIWDTDGRTVLLIERNCIHNYIIMDHTLEEGEICIEFVATGKKASSHTTLYASHGIISFQTSLGRVINSISDSYDDELKLSILKQQIQSIVKEEIGDDNEPASLLKSRVQILNLKLEYLKLAMRVYSLSKCKEICEHLMTDEQFDVEKKKFVDDNHHEQHREIDSVVWRQLAARSLFCLNLNFALMIYRKHGMLTFARVLNEIIRDVYLGNLDAKSSLKTRLMVLLGCYFRE